MPALKRGAAFFLNAIFEDEHIALAFDGLQRLPGSSKLGDFHYIPVMFAEGRKRRELQRALLNVFGLFLSRLQGRFPSVGVVWHGKECRATRLRLTPDPRKAKRLIEELCRIQANDALPPLVLNDHCAACEFRQRCYHQALEEDNLRLLRGIKEKEVKAYARKGILTVTQLAHTFRPRCKGKRQPPRANRHFYALQALAVRDKKVYLLGTPQHPTCSVRVYLDVEGDPERGFDYLIGLIIVIGDQEQRHSFWADTCDQEDQIFEQFLSVIGRYDDYRVFCYGGYERAFLKRLRNRARRKATVDHVLKSTVNVLSLIYAHVYFPTYSNGLKDIGTALGFSWSEPLASGQQSLVWRARWGAAHDEVWKQTLLKYNQDYCAALKRVTEFIYASATAIEQTAGSPSVATDGPPVATVQDLDKLSNDRKWRKVCFFHPDFDHINGCAYFDYQRDRVIVRTSKVLKKNRKRLHERQNNRLRINQRVEVTNHQCPGCGGRELVRRPKGTQAAGQRPSRKLAFDLVFTANGIRRKVIECRTRVHECLNCREIFLPKQYQRLAKHFHALTSWAMFEHIAH